MIFNKKKDALYRFESTLDSYVYLTIKKQKAILKKEDPRIISHLELMAKKQKTHLDQLLVSFCENYNPKLLMEMLKKRADSCETKIHKLRQQNKPTTSKTCESMVIRETRLKLASITLNRIFE